MNSSEIRDFCMKPGRNAPCPCGSGKKYKKCCQKKSEISSPARSLGKEPTLEELIERANNLYNLGLLDSAEASYHQVLQINPDFVDAHVNLANIHKHLGRLDEAVAGYRRAILINPDIAQAHNNLGNILKDLGQLNEAEACYRQALLIKPDYTFAYSNLLLIHNYTASHVPSYYLEEAERYGQIMSNKVTARFRGWRCVMQPQRLRLGFVSGDLRSHPVGYFLEGILGHIDQSRIELIAYSTELKTDELTTRIKHHFSDWKLLVDKSDEAAAQLIHNDGIHILIDLSGHTSGNRLPIFAWKPAPVQVSWLGYFATTGIPEIDYLLADPWTLPETDEACFTEKIWRLPETRLCFTVPDVDVDISPLPALVNGHITFGCFNNLTKVNDAVVALWARVLMGVPGSRLLLKAKLLNRESVCLGIAERFSSHGIGVDRLILEGFAPRAEYLAAYNMVDIALDPFPYTGGTTSVEALWMGVPVLTLMGDRLLSRQGVGIMMNAGLGEWVATDPDDYVARAIAHASDINQLATLRAGLREQVLASPLFDASRFAINFEAAVWGMWQTWVEQQENN